MGDRKLRMDRQYTAIPPWHRYVRSYVLDLWNSSVPLWRTSVNSSNRVQRRGKDGGSWAPPGRQQTQTPGCVSWSLLVWAGCSAALLASWYLSCWEARTRQLASLDRYSRPRRCPGMIYFSSPGYKADSLRHLRLDPRPVLGPQTEVFWSLFSILAIAFDFVLFCLRSKTW